MVQALPASTPLHSRASASQCTAFQVLAEMCCAVGAEDLVTRQTQTSSPCRVSEPAHAALIWHACRSLPLHGVSSQHTQALIWHACRSLQRWAAQLVQRGWWPARSWTSSQRGRGRLSAWRHLSTSTTTRQPLCWRLLWCLGLSWGAPATWRSSACGNTPNAWASLSRWGRAAEHQVCSPSRLGWLPRLAHVECRSLGMCCGWATSWRPTPGSGALLGSRKRWLNA